MMEKNLKIFVLGNGPSLRNFDLKKFDEHKIDTIGLNAAYRHWDKIGWYPTYYSCLDPELINTHHDNIYKLFMENKVKKIFVRGNFLKYHPDLKNNENVYILESYLNHGRAKSANVKFIKSKFFNTIAPGKVTTGSYAIRFTALLGYKEIFLLGIDCKYVEFIKECKKKGGYKLEITETPTNNPNYFFDDYQQKGDCYQIPNPKIHNGLLHIQTFRVLKKDMNKFKMDIQIINCNYNSILFEEKIFPFIDYNDLDFIVKKS